MRIDRYLQSLMNLLQLAPEWQQGRSERRWSGHHQAHFLRDVLAGLPIGVITQRWAHGGYVVVDGLERLRTLQKAFVEGGIYIDLRTPSFFPGALPSSAVGPAHFELNGFFTSSAYLKALRRLRQLEDGDELVERLERTLLCLVDYTVPVVCLYEGAEEVLDIRTALNARFPGW